MSHRSHGSHRFLSHTDLSDLTDFYWLKPMGYARLHAEGTCNRSDDSGKKLEDLNDGIPFDFHFTQNLIVNIGHTDLIDHTDFLIMSYRSLRSHR